MAARILIVEDDAVFRKHLARLFVREGYEVYTAENCATALRYLMEIPFDTLLLDVALPDGSGLDLLATVGGPQRPRTLVMTACTTPEHEAWLQRLKVGYVLSKPVDLLRLVELIREQQADSSRCLAEQLRQAELLQPVAQRIARDTE